MTKPGLDMRLADIAEAFRLLTRLPMGAGAPEPRLAQSVWAFSLVGIVVGGVGGGTLAVLAGLGVPPLIASVIALALMIKTTAALHEDGLADCADAAAFGKTRDERLAIMKDSRVGAYGVVALCLTLVLRVGALAELAVAAPILGPIVAASLSRAMMAPVMAALPFARSDGLASLVGRPSPRHAAVALILAAPLLVYLTGAASVAVFVLAGLAATATAVWAQRSLGGQTGDVLGATQQLSECLILAALATILTVS